MHKLIGKGILLGVLEHLQKDWTDADEDYRVTIERTIDELQMHLYYMLYSKVKNITDEK